MFEEPDSLKEDRPHYSRTGFHCKVNGVWSTTVDQARKIVRSSLCAQRNPKKTRRNPRKTSRILLKFRAFDSNDLSSNKAGQVKQKRKKLSN